MSVFKKKSHVKRIPNPDWREEFYRNGRPDEREVIVISDTPTPPDAYPRQPTQIETRGMKRSRRTPTNKYIQSSQALPQPTSSAYKRRRKEVQTNQTHSQYGETSYRSYVSNSSHTSAQYREPISARESHSSAASSRQAIIPNYDEKDGHYITKYSVNWDKELSERSSNAWIAQPIEWLPLKLFVRSKSTVKPVESRSG
ncbi:13338_t:CDS:2, partial [Acaulospora colombiana]